MAKASTLTDTFDTQIDTAKWTVNNNVVWSAGRVAVSERVGAYSWLSSKVKYDLTASSVFAKVTPPAVQTVTTETSLVAVDSSAENFGIYAMITYPGSVQKLNMRHRQSSTNDDVAINYDPVAMAYLRLSVSGTTVSWDTSPDGVTWTNRRTRTSTITFTSMEIELVCGQWSSGATQSTGYFDNVNTVPAVLPKTATLTDTFDTTLDKAVKWTATSAATVWDSSGRAKIPVTTSYWNLGTPGAGTYDFTGSSFYAKVTPPPAGAGSRETFMEIVRGGVSNDKLSIYVSGTDISARRTLAGVVSGQSTVGTYNPTTHAWWRIRESAGTTYFDTSLDGASWINGWSVANGFAVTQVWMNFASGYWGTESAADTFIDNVNTVPATGGRPKAYVAGSFQKKPGKVWTGAAWVEKPWKVWTGSVWKTLT